MIICNEKIWKGSKVYRDLFRIPLVCVNCEVQNRTDFSLLIMWSYWWSWLLRLSCMFQVHLKYHIAFEICFLPYFSKSLFYMENFATCFFPCCSFYSFLIYWLIWEGDRERYQFVVPLISLVASCMCPPLTRDRTATLAYWDNALTNWIPRQGLALFLALKGYIWSYILWSKTINFMLLVLEFVCI